MPTDPNVSYTVLGTTSVHTHEIEIKKSRFLALLKRVDSETSARGFIAETKAQYRDARHHCSAFIIGPARETARSSDDGEPSGTAGMPMMQALSTHKVPSQRDQRLHSDLSDICAVVVRWFGGVKLGAGGLIRAYSGSVTAALETAPLKTRMRSRSLTVRLAHADAGRVEADVRAAGFAVLPTRYAADAAVLTLAVPDREFDVRAALDTVTSLTAGQYTPHLGGVDWHDIALL
ncbi:IMPACT family protein [Kocuria sp. cx-455]|uniref:IMPACT family protein n=1 Tax=Kocuria sp. cx-455 TaxID=2771377 RepID=UPI003D715C61